MTSKVADAVIFGLGALAAGVQVMRAVYRWLDWQANRRPLPDPFDTRTP